MKPDQSRHRAAHLRKEAASLPTPLATAYRRRAAELELVAHIGADPTTLAA